MAIDRKPTRTEVRERDPSTDEPLPAAFNVDRPSAPLAVRPARYGRPDSSTAPGYPQASASLARRSPRPASAGCETTPNGSTQDDACCCDGGEGEEETFGDSPGGHVPRTPGWNDGRRGWDPACVERARERLGLRGLPDVVTRRLGRVLGSGRAGLPGPQAEGAERQLAGRSECRGATAQPALALPPRTGKESDNA